MTYKHLCGAICAQLVCLGVCDFHLRAHHGDVVVPCRASCRSSECPCLANEGIYAEVVATVWKGASLPLCTYMHTCPLLLFGHVLSCRLGVCGMGTGQTPSISSGMRLGMCVWSFLELSHSALCIRDLHCEVHLPCAGTYADKKEKLVLSHSLLVVEWVCALLCLFFFLKQTLLHGPCGGQLFLSIHVFWGVPVHAHTTAGGWEEGM